MANRERFRDEELPVTAEVGGEGGSYADPTYQQEAREGVRSEGLHREDPKAHSNTAGKITHDANRRAEIEGGGVGAGPDPAEGMKKPVTE